MVHVNSTFCFVVLVLIAGAFRTNIVDCSEIPDDLDPWQQIAQHNHEHGQLRPLGAEDDDDIYDEVSNEEEFDIDLTGRPAFPPSLKFNNERNRVHKRLPVMGVDYDVPQNKMIKIDKEA